jgi:hypothetical protein
MRLYAKLYLPGQPASGARLMCAPDARGEEVCRQGCRRPSGWLGAVTARLLVQRGDDAGSLSCYYHVVFLFLVLAHAAATSC